MKPVTGLCFLTAALAILFAVAVHTFDKADKKITARLDMIEAKQAQLELQVSGDWELVDLTYLPRIRRNPELIQKEEVR